MIFFVCFKLMNNSVMSLRRADQLFQKFSKTQLLKGKTEDVNLKIAAQIPLCKNGNKTWVRILISNNRRLKQQQHFICT